MHLILADAAPDPAALAQWPDLPKLPGLGALLRRLRPGPRHRVAESDYSAPAARALATHLGWAAPDGALPWAAWRARQAGLPAPPDHGWAFVSLSRWRVDTHQLTLVVAEITDYSAADTDALRELLAPYWAEDGLSLVPDQPGRWLVHGAALAHLRCADPTQAQGRNLAHWMPQGPHALPLLRLQNESQMLLSRHPSAAQRDDAGLVAANAVWLHGAGTLPDQPDAGGAPAAAAQVDHSLSAPAQLLDWPAWAQAWQAMDARVLRPLANQPGVKLTLCGRDGWQTWGPDGLGWGSKIQQFFGLQRSQDMLKALCNL